MMVRSFAVLIFAVLFLQPSAGNKQGPEEAPPLEMLIREAIDRNPAVESSRYREAAAEQRIDRMRAWMPPTVSYQYNRQPLGVMGNVDFMAMHTYSLSQMIPFPGKIAARIDMERANYEMSAYERRDDEVQLAASVKLAYYELWMLQKQFEVNRDLQMLLEDFVVSAERMYEVGMWGIEGVLTAQTRLARLRTEERTIQNDYNKMLAMLNQLLNREPDTELGVIISLPPEEMPLDFESLERNIVDERPDIRAMQSGIEMNEAAIRSARRDYYPDVMVDLMYMQMPAGMDDQLGAMVSVQIPLAPWSGNMVTKRVSEARREKQAREKALENMRTMARSELRQAMYELETQIDVIRLYREDVIPQAEQSAASALAAYQSGRLEYLMVLDSYRMLEMYRMEYYMAQAEFHKSVAELVRQSGNITHITNER
jgi:outer membrane protein, heavy metal efflux system